MGQLGGKDLRDLQGLPRNAAGSYARQAADPGKPSAPVPQGGRPTLLDDGLAKVRAGLTTLDEVLRVTA